MYFRIKIFFQISNKSSCLAAVATEPREVEQKSMVLLSDFTFEDIDLVREQRTVRDIRE